MVKLSQEEIKKYELNILLKFDYFCKCNNLRYCLSGGTLLGAIRHKGFIPWDDDIDVCMPRKDYEVLINNFANIDENLAVRAHFKGEFSVPFAKIIDTRYGVSFKHQKNNYDTNLWMDVFPVDGLPDDLVETAKIYKAISRYRSVLLSSGATLSVEKNTIKQLLKYLIKPISALYGADRCVKNIENIALLHSYEQCKYVGAVTWGLYGIGERMLKSEFEKTVYVDFEGYKFPTFSCWHSYLCGIYGDYMKLPPENKRQNHDMIAYMIKTCD